MQKRTFENLILNGKDLFLEGDITIEGMLEIKNANLIVSGNLTVLDNYGIIKVENGNIIVSGTIKVYHDIYIESGDISCNFLDCFSISIANGDIWTRTNL